MRYYERNDVSKEININKKRTSKEYDVCQY